MKDSATILFIDDDPAVLMAVGDRLALEGYEVVKAASGDEALQALKTVTPDLIILDISMPSMTGLAFLKKISMPNGKPRYPVLVFTARANMETFFEGMEIEGFLAKTSDPNDLLREVDRIVSKGRKAPRATATETKAPRRRILIADDDPRASAQMISFFTNAGYETCWVKDSHAVADTAISRQPDVILLKMIMPRMNAPSLASMLATVPEARGIPVIIYDEGNIHRGETKYINVEKVVPSRSPAEILRVIATVLGSG
jgi:CheY-like chemotaxis protein